MKRLRGANFMGVDVRKTRLLANMSDVPNAGVCLSSDESIAVPKRKRKSAQFAPTVHTHDANPAPLSNL
jgi:hypothetical protein